MLGMQSPNIVLISGVVTATGISAILDAVPNRSRGLAMSVSFFLNVALGAGIGPTAVALAAEHVFGTAQGLGPPLALTAAAGSCFGRHSQTPIRRVRIGAPLAMAYLTKVSQQYDYATNCSLTFYAKLAFGGYLDHEADAGNTPAPHQKRQVMVEPNQPRN
jgi:hypothetical protein